MKCPVCQAKLLPVAGELFCLQCGEAVHSGTIAIDEQLKLEDTSDPLLRRAIMDATGGDIRFVELPQPAAAVTVDEPPAKVANEAVPKRNFGSLRSMLAPAQQAVAVGGMVTSFGPVPTAGAAPQAAAEPALEQPSAAEPLAAAPIARKHSLAWVRPWLLGLVSLSVIVGGNLGIGNYYSSRVYPGVRVGNMAVGGLTFAEVRVKLRNDLPRPALSAMVDGRQYDLGVSTLGAVNLADLEQRVEAEGRNIPLSVAGVAGSYFAAPVATNYALSDDAVAKAVQALSNKVNRVPSNASVVVLGTNVLVLADKPGALIDTAAAGAAIRSAYGQFGTAVIKPVTLVADVAAADYAPDVAMAQTMMGESIQITVKKAHYAPTPGQIASWLVFNGPGKGVAVDSAGVAAYVAGIPGTFDRVATVNGIVVALNARQGAVLKPSTAAKRVTANPKPASIAAPGPVASYTYCIGGSGSSVEELASGTAATLSAAGGWTLGGKVRFIAGTTGCNVDLTLANSTVMSSFDPECEKHTSCRIHNDMAISADAWAKPPSGWVGDTSTYHTELINQVFGQWLGFDHPSCSLVATQSPVLSTPSVIIPGCSPKWYAVPAEMQDTKVLAGF